MPDRPDETPSTDDGSSRRQEILIRRDEDTPTYYANNVSFRTSFWDFTMDFGLIMEATEDVIRVGNVATVILAPQHAVQFAEVLNLSIQKYEALYGPIPRPPKLAENTETVKDE